MAESDSPRHFDEDARASVRAVLKAYKKAHKIGAPTLRVRIKESDPQKRELPISNLQRFLRGSHRTTDMYVGMFADFLKREEFELPEDEPGPLGVFGGALAVFHEVAQSDGLTEERAASLAGEYNKVASQTEPVYPILQLSIEQEDDRPYMPVKETHTLLAGEAELRFEGALVCVGGMNYVAMRDVLTQRPRNYWLERIKTADGFSDKYLSGDATEMLFREEPGDSTMRHEKLTLQAKG
ncbi:hypothetical protein ACXYMP_05730 [Aliiroseovarius sp. CAU 1755]